MPKRLPVDRLMLRFVWRTSNGRHAALLNGPTTNCHRKSLTDMGFGFVGCFCIRISLAFFLAADFFTTHWPSRPRLPEQLLFFEKDQALSTLLTGSVQARKKDCVRTEVLDKLLLRSALL